MIEIAGTPRRDYLNLTSDDLAQAEAQFVSIATEALPRFAAALRDRVKGMSSYGALAFDIVSKEQVTFGLHAVFNKGPDAGYAFSKAAHFFMHYFNVIWAHANEAQRRALLNKLWGCANDSQQGFSPLFCELLTGFIYLSKGNTVGFPDVAYEQSGGADLLIRRRTMALAIEVKTVSFHAGSPLDQRVLARAISRISKAIELQGDRFPSYEIELIFKGNRSVSFQAADDSTSEVIQLLAVQESASTGVWDVTVKQSTPQRVSELANTAFEQYDFAPFLGVAVGGRGVLRYRTAQTSKLVNSIKVAISKARSQLPPHTPGSIWVYLTGAPQLMAIMGRSTVAALNTDGELVRYISEQFEKPEWADVTDINIATGPVFTPGEAGERYAASVNVHAEAVGNLKCSALFSHMACFLQRPMPLQIRGATFPYY